MTLQIGLVGSDGIVLASDLCMLTFNEAARESSTITKILTWEQDAIGFAGDDCSYFVARDIRDSLHKGTFDQIDPELALRTIAEQRYSNEVSRVGDHWIPGIDRCVLLILDGQLWRIDISSASMVHHIRDKAVAGDRANTARCFSELYYDIRKPIAELVFLAAHVITMGNRLNALGVRGLEIVTYSKETKEAKKLAALGPSQLEKLITHSRELEATIRSAILINHLRSSDS